MRASAPSRAGARTVASDRRSTAYSLLCAVLLVVLLVGTGCGPLAPSANPGATTPPFPADTAAVPATSLPAGASATPLPSGSGYLGTATPGTDGVVTPDPSEVPPGAPTPLPSVTPMPSPSPAVVASPLPVPATPFSGSAAWEQVRVLSEDIGSRPTGGPALQRAADYITAQFAALGYRSAQQPYSFSSFQDGPVQLSVQQPDPLQVVARALIYSSRGTVSGELVSAGLGRPADFPTQDLKGRIALIERGAGIPFQEKVNNAVARSAGAVIIYNNASGDFRGSLTQPASVPVVGISQYDGEKLLERMARGKVTVQLRVEAATETQQGANVVAGAVGDPGRKKVIIGAHYDSVQAGPGANDNASGVGTMLEIARAARGHRYPFDLLFIAFGDEEIGLVGSKKYVESLSLSERRQVMAMINLDMVGVGDRMEFGGDAGLVRQATRIAQQSGQNAGDLDIRYGSSSDHASFRDAGIPVVFFYRSDDPNYHTAGDVAGEVAPANLEAAGRTAMGLLDELAKAGP